MNVKAAALRNTADRLQRQLRVDRHACRSDDELRVWRGVLARTVEEVQFQTCTRASAHDQHAYSVALAAARMALEDMSEVA